MNFLAPIGELLVSNPGIAKILAGLGLILGSWIVWYGILRIELEDRKGNKYLYKYKDYEDN